MTRKVKLAIVGGGPSALVAAFHLTRDPKHQYDITIYEMSWRLGGKTASGRGEHGRIEEHGLHILFGCYHNVFHTMLRCYNELREKHIEPERHKFRHFFDAITPHHFGVIGDDRSEPWRPIYIEFPSNRGVPGDAPLPNTWDLGLMAFQIGWLAIIGSDSLRLVQKALPWVFDYHNRWKQHDRHSYEMQQQQQASDELGGDRVSRALLKLCQTAFDSQTRLGKLNMSVVNTVQRGLHSAHGLASGLRAYHSLDFTLALFRGLLADRVLLPDGFKNIDDSDLREWLKTHGAEKQTLESPWMRIMYDAAFSYVNGKPGIENEKVAAGAALRALLLMIFTYKGAFYNKMEAGMGDVIHTPLYLVLKNRGVKFEFFHRLTDVRVADGAVDELVFDTLPVRTQYDPLIAVGDLLCWPSSPKEDLLDASSRERAKQAESYANTAQSSTLVLKRGERSGFDDVLLAIPVACLPFACPSLLRAQPKLEEQSKLSTVQTIAAQLWLKEGLSALGWKRDSPLLSLFHDPLNTWCDMSHLLAREAWPKYRVPGSVAYFCGPMPHEHEFTGERAAEVASAVRTQAEQITQQLLGELPQLWPNAAAANGFNYNLLLDPQNRKGEARLNAQYIRANYEPHARCTLALPREYRRRLRAEDSGLSNLFLTGDWIDNAVHLACVEGAFQAGIRAARAIATANGEDHTSYRIIAEALLNLSVTSPKAPAPPPPSVPPRRESEPAAQEALPRVRLVRSEPFDGQPPKAAD